MAHLNPLPEDTHPELERDFQTLREILGFVPNSVLTMQRRPAIVQGLGELIRGIMDPAGEVDLGFKRLLAHVSSVASGCRYCQAHSALAAEIRGISREKLAAIWDFRVSPLYSEAERAALDFAFAAGSVPNTVDEKLMARLRSHWSDDQIVELLAVISLYGFLNRWNDSMATDLEEPARAMGQDVLGKGGWGRGKH